MSKKQMITKLLKAHELAIRAGEPEECARQFIIWLNHVTSSLASAGMVDECKMWKNAAETVSFNDDDSSFPAQSESMKAILVGILGKLNESQEPGMVDPGRISDLRAISSPQFDMAKLVRFCEELNVCWKNGCFLAVAMLTRAMLDHVPPIFTSPSFSDVASTHGGKSFNEAMRFLDNSSRKIADSHLHGQIQSKESLPNKTQVDCRNALDMLLAEIVRLLK